MVHEAEINNQQEQNEETRIEKMRTWENQDGGVGKHTAPPHTTRTDRKSNGKEIRHQGDQKLNIHPDQQEGRRQAAGAERTWVAMAGPRLAECGTNRVGSLTTSRPGGPTLAHR